MMTRPDAGRGERRGGGGEQPGQRHDDCELGPTHEGSLGRSRNDHGRPQRPKRAQPSQTLRAVSIPTGPGSQHGHQTLTSWSKLPRE